MKTILVAVELSPPPARLLARAAQLANQHQAAVTVLHVMEDVPQAERAVQDEMEQQAIAMLEGFTATAGFHNAPVRRLDTGVPHRCITKAASELSVDVVVIGPGQSESALQRVLGSTADRVVRTASAPVLVVRSEATQPYRHVAVAIDFSPLSQMALDIARALAPDAERAMVHVCEVPLQFEQATFRVGTLISEVESYRQPRLSDSRRQLAQFAREHGTTEKILVLEGTPAKALLDLTMASGVELLALGAQGRNAITQALVGSVARRLIAQSACDLLLVGFNMDGVRDDRNRN